MDVEYLARDVVPLDPLADQGIQVIGIGGWRGVGEGLKDVPIAEEDRRNMDADRPCGRAHGRGPGPS